MTEADLAVNAMLEDKLQQARPDYGWLSEETEDTPDRMDRNRVFIIDPIDGTRSFAEGASTWAHSLAIAEAGEVIAAGHLPAAAPAALQRGQGARRNMQRSADPGFAGRRPVRRRSAGRQA